NLVGAIANEAGLGGGEIGRIDIFDRFSIVSLPAGMPPAVFDALSRTWVSGRQLRISKDTHPAGRTERSGYERPGYEQGGKKFGKPKNQARFDSKPTRGPKKGKTFAKTGSND